MKKVLLGLVALSAVSFAQGDMYLNARVGGDFVPKYDKFSDEGTTILTDKTDGFGGEIALEGYKSFNDNFDLGVGLAYQMHADRKTQHVGDVKISGVEYDSVPVYLTAKYNFGLDSEIKPYLKANLGYSFNLNPSKIKAKESGVSESYKMKVDNGMYWGAGVGLEYNNFTVDVMYAVTGAKTKPKDDDGSKKNNYYERIVLSAGYRFNL